MLVAREAALILGWTFGLVLTAAMVDYVLRMPGMMRTTMLIIGIVVLVGAIARRVGRAAGFCPSLVDLALRLEKAGTVPEARGLLASGLEFAASPPAGTIERGLAQRVADRAREVFEQVSTGDVVDRTLMLRAFALLVVAAIAIGTPSIARPDLAVIGAQRVLLPFTDAKWPRRTVIQDTTSLAVHPIGTAVPLRALLTRTDAAEGRTRVTAEHRLVIDGRTEPWRTSPLTAQRASDDGELYERLLEPTVPQSAERVTLEYRIETKDDRTELRSVRLVHPPRVTNAALTIQEPAYLPEAAGSEIVRGERLLASAPGAAELVSPILAGSKVSLTLETSRPLPVPEEETEREVWLALTLGIDDIVETPLPSFASNEQTWVLTWDAEDSKTLRIVLTDEDGIRSREPLVLGFDTIVDRPPSAVLTAPDRDEAVLAGALVPVAGEGRDDLGLEAVWVDITIEQRTLGSDGNTEPGETRELMRVDDRGAPALNASMDLDLATVDAGGRALEPGDTVVLEAVSVDVFAAPDGTAREPVRSTPRRLLIIEEAEFVERIRNELGAVRRSAIQLDRDQAELTERVRSGVLGPGAERDQASIGERSEGQRRAVERLAERAEQNRLGDETLEDLLDRAAESLGRAGEASQRAGEQLQRASEAEAGNERRSARQDAETEQRRVRDELANLAEMLDRGEDDWLARRGVERLLEEQRRLQDETEELGQETVGQSLDQLTPEQLTELERLAEQQADLAERAEQAIEQLAEQSRNAAERDPSQSQALARAAARARSEGVTEQIEQAGESLEQNQTSQAQQQQQDAIEALEQVLEDIDRAERGRDERLRRVLADLMDEIERLIAMQEDELVRLAEAPNDGLGPLADGMIALHEATLGAADTARAGDGGTDTIATTLERAGTSQTSAIVELRGVTPLRENVERLETESLELLRQALEEARALDEAAQDRQQQRARDELARAYKAALAEQVAIREDTEPLVGERLGRREQRTVRGLGERQLLLRATLNELLNETEGLSDAAVFDFAHRRLDNISARAGEAMGRGEATSAVIRDQSTVETVLRGLVEALDQEPPSDEFREDSGGGQGGGAGGGQGGEDELVPPIAQLKLLRALQAEALDRTRDASDAPDDVSAEFEREEIGELQGEIADLGQQMLEALQESSAGGQPLVPGGEPEQAPDPDAEGDE
ncbi:MAG: hypothetical protein AAGB51_03210 [Planctomycetota bacterium]